MEKVESVEVLKKIAIVEPEVLTQAIENAKNALQYLKDKKKKSRVDSLSIEYLRTFINNPTPVNYILLSCGRAHEMKRKEEPEEEKLVVGTWLPVFPGFYETCFNGDILYDNEIEYIKETVEPEELAAVLVDKFYETKAFDKLYKEYQESTARQCVSVILNELRNLHYVEDIELEEICSPKYYNFVNDSINVKVTFSAENIRNIKAMIEEHTDEWKEYLKQTYTSRDGFISHHSNSPDAEEWDIETALTDRHNAGAILEFLCGENNITSETLYYGCEENVQMDIKLHKKECIEKGWYVPKNICLDWFRSLRHRFKGKYKFRIRVTLAFPVEYILETPKQRYVFAITKQEPVAKAFIVKRIFKIFLFAKLKEEKKT